MTGIIQEQEVVRNAEKAGSTTGKPKEHLRRYGMLLETIRAVLQVQTLRRMGKPRRMMKMTKRFTTSAMMTNLAG